MISRKVDASFNWSSKNSGNFISYISIYNLESYSKIFPEFRLILSSIILLATEISILSREQSMLRSFISIMQPEVI